MKTEHSDLSGHLAATRRGAIEGGVASAIVALGGSYYLSRRHAGYRKLPLSLKAMGVVIFIIPVLTIQAERRGVEYERATWEDDGVRMLEEKRATEHALWQELTTKERIGEWANRHQYGLILGGWASSLAVAGAIISRDKLQTTAQKVVQARMWAQGLTIGLLIVAGALTHSQRAESAKHLNTDHSWKDLLDQQERDRQEARMEATPPTRRIPASI